MSDFQESSAYARIDVPLTPTSAVGSGSYLRLGAYVDPPDKSIIDDFSVNATDSSGNSTGIDVQKSTVTTTQLTDDQVETNGKTKQTNTKEYVDLSTTKYTPSTSGVLLKTDHAMYLTVPDALVRKVGYESTKVTTGDHCITVANGIHYVDATQGVKITSDSGNIDLIAAGYVNMKSEGPTTEWTYGDKTSKTKGKSISYTDGQSWAQILGQKYQEVYGSNDSYSYGEKFDYVSGAENAVKFSTKAEYTMGATVSMAFSVELKVNLGLSVSIGFDILKICVLDFKLCNLDAKVCSDSITAKFSEGSAKVFDVLGKSFNSSVTGTVLKNSAIALKTSGIALLPGFTVHP